MLSHQLRKGPFMIGDYIPNYAGDLTCCTLCDGEVESGRSHIVDLVSSLGRRVGWRTQELVPAFIKHGTIYKAAHKRVQGVTTLWRWVFCCRAHQLIFGALFFFPIMLCIDQEHSILSIYAITTASKSAYRTGGRVRKLGECEAMLSWFVISEPRPGQKGAQVNTATSTMTATEQAGDKTGISCDNVGSQAN